MRIESKILVVVLIILIAGTTLTSCYFLVNSYKPEIKYKPESFESIQFEKIL